MPLHPEKNWASYELLEGTASVLERKRGKGSHQAQGGWQRLAGLAEEERGGGGTTRARHPGGRWVRGKERKGSPP